MHKTQIPARYVVPERPPRISLLKNAQRSHIVETEPFHDTFGPKAQRKKPRLDVGTFEELSKQGAAATTEAEAEKSSEGQEGAPGSFIYPGHG